MRFLIIMVLVITASSVQAQDLDSGAMSYQAVGKVQSTSPIRDAPPHGLFNLFIGKELKSTAQGEEVQIIGKKTYSGFSGTHIWYQLKSTAVEPGETSSPKWLYGGVEGETPQIQIMETRN